MPAPAQVPVPEGWPQTAHAEVDGLAMTPPMGWYPWNIFGQEPQNEKLIREIADALVASGMKDAGYAYVGPDEGICFSRGADGKLTTNLARYPSGLRGLGDRHPREGAEIRPLYGRRDQDLQPGHARDQGPRVRGHEGLRRVAGRLHQDRLVQHRGPGHRPDLCGARQGPAGRRPPRRPQPLFVGRGVPLDVGGRHRAHVADDDRHLRPGTGGLGQGRPDRLRQREARGLRRSRPLERPRHDGRRHARTERGPGPEPLQPVVHDGFPPDRGERPPGDGQAHHRHPDQPRGHRRRPGPPGGPGTRRLERRGRQPLGGEAPVRRQPRGGRVLPRPEQGPAEDRLGGSRIRRLRRALRPQPLDARDVRAPRRGRGRLRRRRRCHVSPDLEDERFSDPADRRGRHLARQAQVDGRAPGDARGNRSR